MEHMGRRRIDPTEGRSAVASVLAGSDSADARALAVRWLLQLLEDSHPGHSIELRVPPLGAVQFGEGPRHTRGTPPNVIEIDPDSWLALATGSLSWRASLESGAASASGARASLDDLVPLAWERIEP